LFLFHCEKTRFKKSACQRRWPVIQVDIGIEFRVVKMKQGLYNGRVVTASDANWGVVSRSNQAGMFLARLFNQKAAKLFPKCHVRKSAFGIESPNAA
jgi:hypothetical protein